MARGTARQRDRQAHVGVIPQTVAGTLRLGEPSAEPADYSVYTVSESRFPDAFAALTFGLLDGWWLFEDAQRRLPKE